LWKHPLKWLGNLAVIGGLLGVTMHYLRFGPKHVKDVKDPDVKEIGDVKE
jgi:hypothetical protein